MVEAPPLNISIHTTDDGAMLTVVGDIDALTAHALQDALAEAQHQFGSVSLDLSAVEFIDSAGLGILVGAWRRAVAKDHRFVIRAPSVPVRRNLDISGLGRIFTLDD
jgi:anti-sigma B factor antagonist